MFTESDQTFQAVFGEGNTVTAVGIESVTQTETAEESGGVNKVEVKLTDGTTSEFQVRNGEKGDDGITPKITVEIDPFSDNTGSGSRVNVKIDSGGAPSEMSFPVYNGKTPVRGVDYWTEEDKAALVGDVSNLCANAVKATAKGEFIIVDDVSPLAKTVSAVVSGKNYVDIGKLVNANLADNGNGSYTITKIDGTRFSAEYILNRPIPANTPITASIASYEGTAPTMTIQVLSADRVEMHYFMVNASAKSKSVVLPYAVARARVCLTNSEADGAYATFSGLQLEAGEATEYAPYIDPATVTLISNGVAYTPAADGTCVVAAAPLMTLSTGTEGATICLEYPQDINKAMENFAKIAAPAKIAWVSLPASGWEGSDSLYSQVVAIDGITEYSKVDLLPSVEQLAIFHNKDVAFVTENEDGVVTVYAIGDKPTLDYTIQVQITEVVV